MKHTYIIDFDIGKKVNKKWLDETIRIKITSKSVKINKILKHANERLAEKMDNEKYVVYVARLVVLYNVV